MNFLHKSSSLFLCLTLFISTSMRASNDSIQVLLDKAVKKPSTQNEASMPNVSTQKKKSLLTQASNTFKTCYTKCKAPVVITIKTILIVGSLYLVFAGVKKKSNNFRFLKKRGYSPQVAPDAITKTWVSLFRLKREALALKENVDGNTLETNTAQFQDLQWQLVALETKIKTEFGGVHAVCLANAWGTELTDIQMALRDAGQKIEECKVELA